MPSTYPKLYKCVLTQLTFTYIRIIRINLTTPPALDLLGLGLNLLNLGLDLLGLDLALGENNKFIV